MIATTRTPSHPPIEYLAVADVAAILAASDDTREQFGGWMASSTLGHLEGCIVVASGCSRIPRRTLERYIADRQVKVRWPLFFAYAAGLPPGLFLLGVGVSHADTTALSSSCCRDGTQAA
jgi:hypothetical protein